MIFRSQYPTVRRLGAVVLLCLLGACAEESTEKANPYAGRLKSALDAALASGTARGGIIRVVSPEDDVDVVAVRGEADPAKHAAMAADSRFKIASVSKTMTAAVVLRLWELGVVDLDAPASRYIDSRDVDFDRLHMLEGETWGHDITVRQLLQHRSGLPDYFFDGPVDETGFTPFMQMVLSMGPEPWNPRDSVRYASEQLQPVFAPGRGYHYADTNYVLLGLLIEHLTGRPLATAYRVHLFDRLGMKDSYLEYFEPPPAGSAVSHAFLGEIDFAAVNTSADWAGGGVVSTTADLDRFLRGLFEGKLLENRATLEEMVKLPAPGTTDEPYGLGVMPTPTDNATYLGHYGYYGVMMLYDRERRISVTGTINDADSPTFGLTIASVLGAVDGILPR